MAPLLARLLNRFRPQEGWLPTIVLLVAILCLPAALYSEGDSGHLFALGTLATLAGLRLARSRLAARPAAVAGTLVGALLVAMTVGRLWPPLHLLGQGIGESVAWLRGVPGAAPPFSTLTGFFWQRGNALALRLWWWGQRASGGGDQDTIVLELLLAGLIWGLSLLAGWQIYRRRAALAGLLPTGLVLAVVAFFQGGMAYFYLSAYLGSTLALVAACRLWRSQARWEASGTDYPDDMGLEMVFSLAPWLTALLLLGFFFPVVQVRPLRDAFWRTMDAPWARVEHAAERVFGPIDSSYPRGRPVRGEGEGMPRAHLLGSGPELGQTVVLTVATNDPPPESEEKPEAPAPRRYWRGVTYDIYNGQGWHNSDLERRPIAADQNLQAGPAPGFDLVQHFELLAPEGDRLYAANTPYRLDQPAIGWWRAGGDLAELWGEAERYSVLSRAPQPTVAEMRAASPISRTLPADIAARYLALPESMPQRVLDLAREVASEAPTRYDRAHRLERYLRTYPYDLNLPQPPQDRDLVDYFLFELQEGYCDYYASAMVVMARAVDVPARLATGYAQGSYDVQSRRWVVTEEDGHSWVEVYFEGIGWVEFEPTAGLPSLDRPGSGAEPGPVPALPARPQRWWQRLPWGLLALGGVMALLAGLIVWLWRPRPAQGPAATIHDRYARLLRWGRRLRQPLHDGQTAEEYGRALGGAVEARGRDARWPQVREAATEAPDEIADIAGGFTQAQYCPRPPTERESWHVRDVWKRLRRHLRWLWLSRRPQN